MTNLFCNSTALFHHKFTIDSSSAQDFFFFFWTESINHFQTNTKKQRTTKVSQSTEVKLPLVFTRRNSELYTAWQVTNISVRYDTYLSEHGQYSVFPVSTTKAVVTTTLNSKYSNNMNYYLSDCNQTIFKENNLKDVQMRTQHVGYKAIIKTPVTSFHYISTCFLSWWCLGDFHTELFH